MAETDFPLVTALQAKVYSTKVWKHTRLASFWMRNGMVGSGIADDQSVIHYINELTRSTSGWEAIMPLVQDFQDDGTVGDNELEGREEALEADSLSIKIDQLRHAAKSKGEMSERGTVLRFRMQATGNLGYWLGSKVDELCFLVGSGRSFTLRLDGSARPAGSQLPQLRFAADVTAPSSNRAFFAGAATSTATLTASDVMTWNRLVELRAEAKARRIRPLRAGGIEFVVVMNNYQMRDLRLDPDWKTAAANAQVRGPDNPLWKGAAKVVDGLAVFETERVCGTYGLASGSKWGAAGTVDGGQALLLGAQALGFANIEDVRYETSPNRDYNNKENAAIVKKLGIIKPVWYRPEEASEQDYAVMSLYTAAARLS